MICYFLSYPLVISFFCQFLVISPWTSVSSRNASVRSAAALLSCIRSMSETFHQRMASGQLGSGGVYKRVGANSEKNPRLRPRQPRAPLVKRIFTALMWLMLAGTAAYYFALVDAVVEIESWDSPLR
jgi:hypothetical protein